MTLSLSLPSVSQRNARDGRSHQSSKLFKVPGVMVMFWIYCLTSTPNRKVHKKLPVEGYSELLYSR